MSGRRPTPTGYTSAEFQRIRKAILAAPPADRAFFRRWAQEWIGEQGQIRPGAPDLPEKGVPESPVG